MSRAKSVLGIAVLFALALSAFGVASASAETATAYTCETNSNGTLLGDHCLTKAQGGSGNPSQHVAFTENETTTITATNENTTEETKARRSGILKGALAGVATEVTCAEVHGEGTLINKKTEGGEMFAHAEGKLHYTGCVVKAPAEKGCKVAGETITTELLTGKTLSPKTAEIKPKNEKEEVPPKFAEIKIEGCSISALNNTFPVTGSLVAQISGATLTSTHAEITTQNTLKFGGVKAGIDGALTLKGHRFPKEGEEVEATRPISAT